MIGLTLYYKDDVWIAKLCDVEAVLLRPNIEVNMYIEWFEGIMDLVNHNHRVSGRIFHLAERVDVCEF